MDARRRPSCLPDHRPPPAAIDGARGRFPGSSVDYTPADLLNPPASWRGAFDLVVEIYTVQPLHGTARTTALAMLPRLVAPGGTLGRPAFCARRRR
jgi:hypothetical protein